MSEKSEKEEYDFKPNADLAGARAAEHMMEMKTLEERI